MDSLQLFAGFTCEGAFRVIAPVSRVSLVVFFCCLFVLLFVKGKTKVNMTLLVLLAIVLILIGVFAYFVLSFMLPWGC